MTEFRIREAARLLGVSDDTVRRWVNDGKLTTGTDASGVQVVDGRSLAEHAKRLAAGTDHSGSGGNSGGGDTEPVRRSARNTFTGIVTKVDVDGVMAVVEMHSGPHRLVSIMTREAVEELELEIGSRATALVKATHVVVETPR